MTAQPPKLTAIFVPGADWGADVPCVDMLVDRIQEDERAVRVEVAWWFTYIRTQPMKLIVYFPIDRVPGESNIIRIADQTCSILVSVDDHHHHVICAAARAESNLDYGWAPDEVRLSFDIVEGLWLRDTSTSSIGLQMASASPVDQIVS